MVGVVKLNLNNIRKNQATGGTPRWVVGQFRSITRVQQYFMCYNLVECPDVALLD